MPLIPNPDLATLPAAERLAFEAMPSNIWRSMLHAPPLFTASQAMGRAIMTTGRLAPDLRELVILATQRIEGGNNGWALHVPIALQCGCSGEKIAAIEMVDLANPIFSGREKAALNLSRNVAQQNGDSDAAVSAAKQFFSSAEIIEIIVITGYYGMISRFANTLCIDIDPVPGIKTTNFKPVSGPLIDLL